MFKQVIIVLILGCLLGCERQRQSVSKTDGKIAPSTFMLSNDSEIRVLIYQHLIRNLLPSGSNLVFFVKLNEEEKRLLLTRVEGGEIKSPSEAKRSSDGPFVDKATGANGVALEIKSLSVEGQKAHVRAGYFATAGIVFDFELERDTAWKIMKCSSPNITE